MRAFGRWEEMRAPGDNPHIHRQSTQTLKLHDQAKD